MTQKYFKGLTVGKPFQEEGILIREMKVLNSVCVEYSLSLYHRVAVTCQEVLLTLEGNYVANMSVLYKLQNTIHILFIMLNVITSPTTASMVLAS